jgi:hypothetical protein
MLNQPTTKTPRRTAEVAEAPGSPFLVAGEGTSFEDQLAAATSHGLARPPEADVDDFTELVPPGTPIPYSEPPVRVRLGLDPVPVGREWYFVHPTLDEIEAVEDRERRRWMLYKRIMNDPDAPSEREYDMILPLLGEDTPAARLLLMHLDFGSYHPTPPRKPSPAPAAPPPPCLFMAFGIDISLGETRA